MKDKDIVFMLVFVAVVFFVFGFGLSNDLWKSKHPERKQKFVVVYEPIDPKDNSMGDLAEETAKRTNRELEHNAHSESAPGR